MSELFSDQWALKLAQAWNSDPEILVDLEVADFNGDVAFGLKGRRLPECVLSVRHGKVEHAGRYDGQRVDWELRASPDDWNLWLDEGFGLKRLGFAVATGRLVFEVGNYRRMVRNPSLARSFLRVFDLMSTVYKARSS